MLLHEVVERDTDNRRGQAAHDYLAPQIPGGTALLSRLAKAERQQVTYEQHAYGENGAELDDDEKHVPEFLGDVQLDELVHQDHVTRRRDGQPLRDALDQAKEGGFEQLDNIHVSSSGA